MKSKTILIKSPNQKFEYHTSLCHSLFNPRSREGSDNHDPEAIKMHKAFQSSLPRRERQVSSDYLLDLNPISIHAPAKGATQATIHYAGVLIFQSTLPRRERRLCVLPCSVALIKCIYEFSKLFRCKFFFQIVRNPFVRLSESFAIPSNL